MRPAEIQPSSCRFVHCAHLSPHPNYHHLLQPHQPIDPPQYTDQPTPTFLPLRPPHFRVSACARAGGGRLRTNSTTGEKREPRLSRSPAVSTQPRRLGRHSPGRTRDRVRRPPRGRPAWSPRAPLPGDTSTRLSPREAPARPTSACHTTTMPCC